MKSIIEFEENQVSSFGKAMKIIQSELEKDKEIYYGWQANLAMTIFDNSDISPERCNDIAKQFLNKLIKGY